MTKHFLLLFFISFTLWGCQPEKSVLIDIEDAPENIELFGDGIISTDLYERDMAISPDGNEIIYSLGNYNQSIRSLVRIRKINGKWGEREILSFSGKYQDIEPFIFFDGTKLYFASTRPIDNDPERSDYNIWVSEKEGSDWGNPKPLDPVINTEGDEFYPSVSENGNIYFTTTKTDGIGREDIYRSRFIGGAYQEPQILDSNVNSAAYEFNAWISPGEDLIIFSSYGRNDDMGGGDLYFSHRDKNGKWRKARNMGPQINSGKLDYCPFIDIDRGVFYFTSDRSDGATTSLENVDEFIQYAHRTMNGMGNIYRIGIDELVYEW